MIPIIGNVRFMEPVHEIVKEFGGVNATAKATGTPQQTVNDWYSRKPPEIPPWRRPIVAAALDEAGKSVSPEARAYLASQDRTPKARASC